MVAGVTSDLKLRVSGLDIIVTMPGTEYRVTFQRPAGGRELIPKPDTTAVHYSVPWEEFLDQAWIAAKDKARELGWIV